MEKLLGLKVGGVPEHFNLPWRLAIEEGLFHNIGLSIHWSDMTGGTGQMVRGLESGSLDVAILLTEGITKAILEGLNCKIIQVYVQTPLHWGVHVPFKSEIKNIQDLKGKTYAISRMGSGSHLMSYVMADQAGWNTNNLKFNVIGDVYGGLWALENNEAQAFLWEKYTTHPFTEQQKCRYIDEVVTPWPCFVIAVRNEVYELHKEAIDSMCNLVNLKATEVKNSKETIDIISWRYNLKKEQVEKWLSETEWNYTGEQFIDEFQKTVDYLIQLNLLTDKNAENWQEKLF
ncbi:MAG: ABC transporter substrate-binding protein [Flavobacteriia bacterium]|nr:ABC transporter substrate-binding protein [Flavobacteriia bacterium]